MIFHHSTVPAFRVADLEVNHFTRIRREETYFYTGCPQGRPCLGLGRVSFFFFFFVVVTNLHINLFIKLSPLLEGMYCSDCLQQKRPNQNLLLARISRGRGPPHPCLCDVKSSFDLFIKPGLNSLLVAAILFTSFRLDYAVSKRKLTILKRQMERITSKKHLTVKTVEIGELLAKESCFV